MFSLKSSSSNGTPPIGSIMVRHRNSFNRVSPAAPRPMVWGRSRLSRILHRLEFARKPIKADNNGSRPTDEMRWLVFPLGFWAVERVHVPHGANLPARHSIAVPRPGKLFLIPILANPGIVEHLFRPFLSTVAKKDLEPHHIDPDRGIWKSFENILPYPTGTQDTNGSRGRQQKHEAWDPGVAVES